MEAESSEAGATPTSAGPSPSLAQPATSPTHASQPSTSPTAAASGVSPPQTPTLTAEERLRALEDKMTKWKEAVATQLNDAARKNKKLREELRAVREEKEAALSELRVQLTEEFQERTSMQREELAALTQQAAHLREEKKAMAAAHEGELQKMRVQLREVIQLEVHTEYKRKEENWAKEMAALQTRAEAKETERAQAEHECDVLKLRLNRLGTQYEELATLLQPEGTPAPSQASDGLTMVLGGSSSDLASNAGSGASPKDPARQQTAVAAAHAQQIEAIKAELQSKEQHTHFLLDRARQEYEAEKTQLLRELQLREEELKVAHTLLKQVQAESSGYMQRVSHAQTERQALEQRYAAKVATLSQELAERMHALDEAQLATRRLQEQLRTAQQQVAVLEEESTMREEAFHSLMLSDDNKRVVMDLQRALQAARDEAEEWKMQYYSASGADGQAQQPLSSVDASTGRGEDASPAAGPRALPATAARAPQAWQDQLAAKEASLASQAAQLEHKAHLLEAAEAKLNDMRRSMASQASLLLQHQKSNVRSREGDEGGVFRDDDGSDSGADRDYGEPSPIISTAASLLPTALHGSLRTLEGHRRRLHLPGSCSCGSWYFSGGGTTGQPLRLRRNPLVVTLAALIILAVVVSMRSME